jgi:hypothetical protein
MTAFTIFKSSLLLAACLLSMGVQASSCITAGRMDNAVWAHQFQSVRLLDDAWHIEHLKCKVLFRPNKLTVESEDYLFNQIKS